MKKLLLIAGAAALGFAGPALAKPGNGHGNGHGHDNAYGYGVGGCPPGLAKKHNGCLPPGQAKKLWAMGQPLPGSVVFYPLPGGLLGVLTPAPAGYQYVRVASDILMMAIGTRMIVGALADLSAM